MAQHVPEEKKGGDNDKSSSSTKPAAANEADDRDVSGDVSDDYRLLPISGSVFLGYDKEAKCDGLKFMAQDEEDDRWGTNNHGLNDYGSYLLLTQNYVDMDNRSGLILGKTLYKIGSLAMIEFDFKWLKNKYAAYHPDDIEDKHFASRKVHTQTIVFLNKK